MSNARDSFLDLEKHRLRLEDSANQLQKALQHWQTWDAEYEALKEEVESVPEASEAKELRRIHYEFDGELLNGKEIDEIFGRPNLKSRDQIINVLERRIDYVTKNIESLQKQLETAENKLAAATVISQPSATDEDGAPITDIIEELDDDDNVISFRLNKPGDSLPHVQEALKKAGVTDLQDSGPAPMEPASEAPLTRQEPISKGKQPETAARPQPHFAEPEPPAKKTVSFSDDAKADEESGQEMSWRAKRVQDIMHTAKEQESISKRAPIIPEDESPEDAALRQEMLKYNMSEVGAVVAELELEDGDSDEDSAFDHDEGFDEEYYDEDDDDDDEDQYGRYKGSVITQQYRRRMLELEKKLGIKSRSPKPKPTEDEDGESSDNDEGIGRIVVKRDAEATSSSSASKLEPPKSNLKDKQAGEVEAKKGVRFASALDIAPEREPAAPVRSEKNSVVDPLSDIVERSGPPRAAETQPAKKASRFKKARDDSSSSTAVPKGPMDIPLRFLDQDRQTAPTGPEGTTIADTLVERETSSAAVPPDEVDDSMVHQAVADEYQRMRRKFIQREGGFLKPEESPIQPVDDGEDAQEPISRFKAARLSRQ